MSDKTCSTCKWWASAPSALGTPSKYAPCTVPLPLWLKPEPWSEDGDRESARTDTCLFHEEGQA